MTTPKWRTWAELQAHLKPHLDKKFQTDPDQVLLNAMVVAPPPMRVRDEITKHRDGMNANPPSYILERERGDPKQPTRSVAEATEAAAIAASYLGLDTYLSDNKLIGSDVIARTTSTTMGLALLANGIQVKRGQEVLLSIHEFFSSLEAWRLRCDRSGGDLGYREIRLYGDTTARDLDDRIYKTVVSEIRENTRVLALTWVDSATGVKLPIRRIGDHVRGLNQRRTPGDAILFVVDGVHGFGVEDASFADLGCDFLVAGCHKWMFGPRGTGITCALPAAWAQVTPTIPPFLPADHAGFRNTPGGVSTYEHLWAMSEAFRFHLDMGKDAVQEHTIHLASRLKAGLSRTRNVRVITPMSPTMSSGIVCCELLNAKQNPRDVKKALEAQGIFALTSDDADDKEYLRFSPSILNDEAHIDRTLKALDVILNPRPKPGKRKKPEKRKKPRRP